MPRVESDLRWTWIFATVGLLVVVVVIGFLTGIVNALDSIDRGLKEASTAVVDIDGNAKPLPGQIEDINANLRKIDGSLKPISGQAGDILSSLTSIDGSLNRIDGSLASTSSSLSNTSSSLVSTSGTLQSVAGAVSSISGSLANTSGSLRGTSASLRNTSSSLRSTSGVLVNVRGLVGSINSRLRLAETTESRGTKAIPINVGRANQVLTPINTDAKAINSGLGSVNTHLTSICQSRVLKVPLPGLVSPQAEC